MKSDFLATVAHEISTPLAVIMASSRDTIELLDEPSPNMDEVLENQKRIEKRVKLIDGIVLDLMDTVAIENGRLSLSRRPLNLPALVRQACDSRFSLPDTAGNSIEYEFEPQLPDIWADPSRIEQVLTNLLSNAVRHTTDGHIAVRVFRAEGGGRQIVCVADTGEGMDGETARSALKQYVSSKPDHWRHGIGLYVCRRVVTAHGGDIWIESEKGRGTSVYFTLNEAAYGDE
jgi:signal transduction histidine kinase